MHIREQLLLLFYLCLNFVLRIMNFDEGLNLIGSNSNISDCQMRCYRFEFDWVEGSKYIIWLLFLLRTFVIFFSHLSYQHSGFIFCIFVSFFIQKSRQSHLPIICLIAYQVHWALHFSIWVILTDQANVNCTFLKIVNKTSLWGDKEH